MKRLGGVLLALFFSVGSMSTFAEASKIAVVDLQKIMRTSDEMKNVQAKLEQTFKPRRDKLMGMEADLKTDMDAFKRDGAVMSQVSRKAAEEKIMTAQQLLERDGQQYQQELNAAQNQAMELFYKKIQTVISSVAKEKKYDLVLQKDAAPFSLDGLDLTEQVMKAVEQDAVKS
jgi:outer membrane protein